jgi:hypothetical protein
MSVGVYNGAPAQRILPGATQQPGQTAGTPASVPQSTAPTQTAAAVPNTAAATTPNPLQPSYLPTPATYNNPYNPSTATTELTTAAQGQDQQQQQALMSMLAAQGISPGSSAAQAAVQNLDTSETNALAPSLVSAQEYGAGLGEQSGLQNLQDLLQSQEYNANAYNTAGLTSAGYGDQDWLAELQGQLGLQGEGLSTSGALAGDQANQQVPLDPSLFSQISSGVGSVASAAAPFLGA